MTTGAEQVLPQPADDRAARLAARAGFGAGVAGALANMLLVALVVLAFVATGRPCRPRSGRSPAPPRARARCC